MKIEFMEGGRSDMNRRRGNEKLIWKKKRKKKKTKSAVLFLILFEIYIDVDVWTLKIQVNIHKNLKNVREENVLTCKQRNVIF